MYCLYVGVDYTYIDINALYACMYIRTYVCLYVCIIYIYLYIVCMSGFDLIHTYSSDALAQGILKSFLAFTNLLMPLPRSEPVCMYVCMYVGSYINGSTAIATMPSIICHRRNPMLPMEIYCNAL